MTQGRFQCMHVAGGGRRAAPGIEPAIGESFFVEDCKTLVSKGNGLKKNK